MAENNKIENFKSSGNIIVDQVGQMGIIGNIVNPNWNYYVTNESGKTNYLAVQILAEIVYWYRPSIKENKTTGIPEFEKKFKHEKYLQRSYYQLEENYNCSKKQAQDALKKLIRIGVVIQHLSDGVHGGNVMYLELVPDVLKKKVLMLQRKDPIECIFRSIGNLIPFQTVNVFPEERKGITLETG